MLMDNNQNDKIKKGFARNYKSFRLQRRNTATSYSKNTIETILKTGDFSFVSTNKNIASLYIKPDEYKSMRTNRYQLNDNLFTFPNLCLKLYKQVDNNTIIDGYQLSNIIRSFTKLLKNKQSSFKDYWILPGNATFLTHDEILARLSEKKQEANGVYDSIFKTHQLLKSQEKLNFIETISFLFKTVTAFYKTFFPDLLPNWLTFLQQTGINIDKNNTIDRLPKSVIDSELKFSGISTREEMYNFLDNSPSFYHKACLFFLQTPISLSKFKIPENIKQRHHLFPIYLTTIYSDKSFNNINAQYNLIELPKPIHILMHAIRFLEFGYPQDLKAVKVLYYSVNANLKKSKTTNKNDNTINQLENLFQDINTWVKNRGEFQNEFAQNRETLKEYLKQQSKETRSVYDQDTVWKNFDYPKLPELRIPAKTAFIHSDMASILLKNLELWFERNPPDKFPQGWNNRSATTQSPFLSKYINNNENNPGAFWGFYLKRWEKKLITTRKKNYINRTRGISKPPILNIIDHGGYKWINSKYNLTLIIEPKKYKILPYLVYDLIKTMPAKNRPSNWIYFNHSLKANQINESVLGNFRSVMNQQKHQYLGWRFEKI